MFGVGLNPLYLRRLERRQASGAVRRREADQRVQELIDGIYEEATGAQSAAATAATPFEESWDAIFGDYSVADLDKECGVSGLATAAEPQLPHSRSCACGQTMMKLSFAGRLSMNPGRTLFMRTLSAA